MESVVPDRNDKTGELGIWMHGKDARADLSYRAKLQTIIDEARAYWQRTQK